MSTEQNRATARRFLSALETFDAEAIAALFTEDAEQIEQPNRLKPNGDQRSSQEMSAAAARGAAILTSQSYEVMNEVASGDMLVLEFTWTGTLAIDIGSLSAGDVMRAHCAVVMEFQDGRIRRLRNYDCYEPF